ncbi:sodium- and chloride-dependent glycine transporter 1-like [Ornithodoros turicata]|uniref:sodium- and chloride-dependent glycine transporter 1-like n=1 Tax=Ornithodoros turicata TaxID=34597 RepID=UPI0031391EF0
MRHNDPHLQYWSGSAQFYAMAYLCTTGLTNLTWFPYAVYKRGRGTYLIIYTIITAVFVIPLMYLEAMIAQFSHAGNRGVFESAPIFAGVSYTMAYFQVVTTITGAFTISYAFLYLFRVSENPLPWELCTAAGGSNCYSVSGNKVCKWVYQNLSSKYREAHVEQGIPLPMDGAAVVIPTEILINETVDCTPGVVSSVALFHKEHILGLSAGMGEIGQFHVEMAIASAITWLIIYALIIFHATSIRLVAYSIIASRAFTIAFIVSKVLAYPGDNCGIHEIFKTNFVDLFSIDLWRQATERSIYSVGCSATFLRLMSWNLFNNNFRVNVLVIAWLDFGTTVVTTAMVFLLFGLIADATHSSINNLVLSMDAPFVTILEALAVLEPQRDFVILYCTLVILMGVGRMVLVPEMTIEVLLVDFPSLKRHNVFLKLLFCVFSYSCGLLFCTSVGPYVIVLLEYYLCKILGLLLTIVEVTALVYVYGLRRLLLDCKVMTHKCPHWTLQLMWCVIPFVLTVFYVVGFAAATDIAYDQYFYPPWSKAIGIGLALTGLGIIPCYAISLLMTNKSNMRVCLAPSRAWGPNIDAHVCSEYMEKVVRCYKSNNKTLSSLTKITTSEKGPSTELATDYPSDVSTTVTTCVTAPQKTDKSITQINKNPQLSKRFLDTKR